MLVNNKMAKEARKFYQEDVLDQLKTLRKTFSFLRHLTKLLVETSKKYITKNIKEPTQLLEIRIGHARKVRYYLISLIQNKVYFDCYKIELENLLEKAEESQRQLKKISDEYWHSVNFTRNGFFNYLK